MGERPGPGRRAAGRGHAKRRAARRQAIDILFQADLMQADPVRVLEEWRSAGRKTHPYAEDLVRGVSADLGEIDRLLGDHLEGWTVPRMAGVDRAIVRVACHELRSGVPTGVVINEAVEAARELSTEDSGRFVNGVLGRIAREAGEPVSGAPDSG
ncbi:MAG TPA: transcription antitermination factor NusB [Actinomycetota bacterium]